MGFLWVNGFSFFHCVASPFHSFVTTLGNAATLSCDVPWGGSRAGLLRRWDIFSWFKFAVDCRTCNHGVHEMVMVLVGGSFLWVWVVFP